MKKIIATLFLLPFLTTCSVSYTFNGASIDYTKIKTMDIKDFRFQTPMTYAPLLQVFNEHIKDMFDRNTKLRFTDLNPDLELEGEIVRYDTSPLAVKEDTYASQTRLTMSVRMRYRNNVEPQKDKEETFTAYRDFDNTQMLQDVQDQLGTELSREIVDQIFNSTMSDW